MLDFPACAGGNIDVFVESIVNARCTSDQYDNDVTIIDLNVIGGDMPLRMVHHHPAQSPLQKATIYQGREFVRYSAYCDYAKPDAARWVKIGGYEAEWINGKLVRLQNHPTGPLIRRGNVEAVNGSFTAFLVLALSAVITGNLWQIKDVKQDTARSTRTPRLTARYRHVDVPAATTCSQPVQREQRDCTPSSPLTSFAALVQQLNS